MAQPENDGFFYDVESHIINYHLKTIFSDNELEETSVTRNFRVTSNDGSILGKQYFEEQLLKWFKPAPMPKKPYGLNVVERCTRRQDPKV